MVDVMGENVRPFLPSVWASLKKYPENQKFNDDIMSAVMEYVGYRVDQGKELSALRRDFADEYGNEYLNYVDAVYEGVKNYPFKETANVVESKVEESEKQEDKQNGEQTTRGVQRQTARPDSESAGARPDSRRSGVAGSVSASETEGNASDGTVERGISEQVVEKKLTPAQKKTPKPKKLPDIISLLRKKITLAKAAQKLNRRIMLQLSNC